MTQSRKRSRQRQSSSSPTAVAAANLWRKWKFVFSLKSLRERVAQTRGGRGGGAGGEQKDKSSNASHSGDKVLLVSKTDFVFGEKDDDLMLLDHSAARHRIAVRPPRKKPQQHLRKARLSNSNSLTSLSDFYAEPTALSTTGHSSMLPTGHSSESEQVFLLSGINRSRSVGGGSRKSSKSNAVHRRHSYCEDDENAEHEDAPTTTSPVSSSLATESTELEFRSSTINSNVIFKRSSPQFLLEEKSFYSGRQRFLTSIEHWTLANEGLRKSICNLTSAGYASDSNNHWATNNLERSNSLDSVCSGSSSFSHEVNKLLEDLSDSTSFRVTKTGILLSSGGGSLKSHSTTGGGCGDPQCDAADTELEIVSSSSGGGGNLILKPWRQQEDDVLENVNVREMRKMFLLVAAAAAAATAKEDMRIINNGSRMRAYKSCVELPTTTTTASGGAMEARRSVVRALVMKFDGISCQPSSL